jgi:hypothetical protein
VWVRATTVAIHVVSCAVVEWSAVCWYHVCQKLEALCSSDTLVPSHTAKWWNNWGGYNTNMSVVCLCVNW